jgi:hypothetical protein
MSSEVCTRWAEIEDLPEDCAEEVTDANVLEDALDFASDLLFVLSGRQFPGECTSTVRPECRHTCRSDRVCRCAVHEIKLGRSPILEIEEVLIDGEVLDPAFYRVDDWATLVRLPDADGSRPPWPSWQRLDLDAAIDDRTFEVTFTHGRNPPAAGRIAAAYFACEMARNWTPGVECKLPKRITSITRQGVSMAILDPFRFLDNGRTGIYEVDLFLSAYNSGGVRRRAAVASPDVGPRARRADTAGYPSSS